MRKWLAFTGVAIAVVGVAVLVVAVSVYAGPSGTVIQTLNAPGISPGSNYTDQIPVTLAKSATFDFSWKASDSVQVFLFVAAICGNGTEEYVCPSGNPVASWWNLAGTWSWSGGASAPWLVVVFNPNATTASFSGSMVETYPATGSFAAGIGLLVIILASIVLLALGALALFLGLFLRGGIYGGPPPSPVGPADSDLLHQPGDSGSDDDWDDDRPPAGPDDDDL